MDRNEVTKRFLETVDSIYTQDKDFLIESDIKKSTFSQVRSGRQQASLDMILALSSVRNSVNTDYILTGKGKMMKDDKDVSFDENIKQSENEVYTTYLLPMSAMGGSLTGFSASGTSLSECELVVSPIKNVDFAITVYGESMAPEYPSGSRILIKRINPSLFIEWGKVYVLDTPNGVIVKEVIENKKEGYITCHSINPDPKFTDFDVPLSEIYGMYRVLMCLSIK